MKTWLNNPFILLFFVALVFSSCKKETVKAKIETEFGDMILELYDSTPIHRDNFVKLVNEGFYDDLLFHRVINSFMIQGGDPKSADSNYKGMLGQGGPGYTLEAEIGAKHFKGAVAAARLGDDVNPDKSSSGSQFYIVHGMPITDELLQKVIDGNQITYTEEEKNRYKTDGGYPFLDGGYTVFGMLTEGLDVLDKIATQQTASLNRPIKDIKMKIVLLN